jgi:16S rRNA (guanine527-N7)-methyltransferase
VAHDFEAALIACEEAAGIHIDPDSRIRLEMYYSMLRRWNQRVSLTSLPLDGFPAASLNRLLIEPAIAASVLPNEPVSVLDIGSGGGSPAIPLKILRPLANFTLTEARQKKVAFLREAVVALGLTGVSVSEGRVEEHAWVSPFDWVTVRAVRLDQIISEVLHKVLKLDGRVLIFGGVEPVLAFREERRHTLPGGSSLIVLTRDP